MNQLKADQFAHWEHKHFSSATVLPSVLIASVFEDTTKEVRFYVNALKREGDQWMDRI